MRLWLLILLLSVFVPLSSGAQTVSSVDAKPETILLPSGDYDAVEQQITVENADGYKWGGCYLDLTALTGTSIAIQYGFYDRASGAWVMTHTTGDLAATGCIYVLAGMENTAVADPTLLGCAEEVALEAPVWKRHQWRVVPTAVTAATYSFGCAYAEK